MPHTKTKQGTEQPRIPENAQQAPFRQTTLLTSGSFTSYCDRNNLRTSEKELEKLHCEGVLYPAVRVHVGVEELSRIYAHHQGQDKWIYVWPKTVDEFKPKEVDPQLYYQTPGLMIGRENWMNWYRDDIDFPSTLPFFPWKGRYHGGFTTDRELAGNDYELLYDERQILALKIIRMYERTHGPNEDYRDALVKRLSELYRFLRLYIDAEILYEEYQKRRREQFQNFLEEFNNATEARREWRSHYRLTEEKNLRGQAKHILTKHGLTVEDLDRWRFFLSQQSIFNEGSVFRRSPSIYIRELDDNALMEAEETNKMIFVLNQFIFLLTGEERTVKSIVGHYDDPRCIICHKCFIPEPHKPTQVTCGSKECIDKQRKQHKKEKAEAQKKAKQK